MTSLVSLALLLCVLGCGHSQSASERWFADRGRQSPTWHSCTRMGAALRDACAADAACATQVTREMTRPCYAARYHENASHARPSDKVQPAQLSPCFWDNVPDHPSSSAEYARHTCTTIVEPTLQAACVAELHEVIDVICQAGAIDLTGAGP